MPEDIYTPQAEEFYTYILWNPLKVSPEFPNGTPFYVGKGKDDRAFDHHLGKDRRNPHKHNTIRKIQNAGLEVKITCAWYGAEEEKAFWVERFLIALYGRKCDGGILTNFRGGGEGGSIHPASRKKMSEAKKGKPLTEEHRRNLGDAHKGLFLGEKHPMFGKHHSETTKRKIVESTTGEKNHFYSKSHSDEAKRKVGDANRGRVRSLESRQKQSAARKGKPHSEEHRRNLAEANRRRAIRQREAKQAALRLRI